MQAIDKQSDRELWNPAIHWWLHFAAAELGMKGTLGGTISALEHGGASGIPNTDPYSDYQAGWCAGDSPAAKWRRWSPVWFLVSRDGQGVLMAHYAPRNDLPPIQRARLDGELGMLASAALHVLRSDHVGRLLAACLDKDYEGRAGIIQSARRKTEIGVRAAHREWDAAAAERSRWHVGPWTGTPVARQVTCPICSTATRQLLSNWARSERLPRKCELCGERLREPRENALTGAPALRRPPRALDAPPRPADDGGRWEREYQRGQSDKRRTEELRAVLVVEKVCRAMEPTLLAARAIAATCRHLAITPELLAAKAVASACRRLGESEEAEHRRKEKRTRAA